MDVIWEWGWRKQEGNAEQNEPPHTHLEKENDAAFKVI